MVLVSTVSTAADTQAVCDAINAKFTQGVKAFPPDESARQKQSHMSVWVARTFNGEFLFSDESRIDTGRVIVRHITKTWDDLAEFRAKTRTALDEKTLPSGIRCRFETQGDVDTDEGWWVSDDSFTYVP